METLQSPYSFMNPLVRVSDLPVFSGLIRNSGAQAFYKVPPLNSNAPGFEEVRWNRVEPCGLPQDVKLPALVMNRKKSDLPTDTSK